VAGKALALLGPTASGKSRLALAVAERLPAEIVSMDSAQVYRGLDIGTAKPTPDERSRVAHHLIDLVAPDENYSTGRWRSDALAAIEGILARNKLPLIVGGTMLYYRALVEGLDPLPPANKEVRAAINAEAAQRGWPALHADLAKRDPAAAKRIAPGDVQRIQRALEVWRLTGQPLTALQTGQRPQLPFKLSAFALIPEDREALNRRIAARFEAMLAAGLVDEVRRLREQYRLTSATPSMRAVGYRQVWQCLEGEIPAAELADKAVAATRQLAKRQLTWLRSFRDVQVVSGADDVLHSFL
jgi:tRNA dimethylallyltransferase